MTDTLEVPTSRQLNYVKNLVNKAKKVGIPVPSDYPASKVDMSALIKDLKEALDQITPQGPTDRQLV